MFLYFDSTTDLKYETRSLNELLTKIIPHFEKFPLQSSKQKDFEIFKKVLTMMEKKEHLDKKGWNKILDLAGQTNRRKSRR